MGVSLYMTVRQKKAPKKTVLQRPKKAITKALIAVRSGSVRIPNKNIRPFAKSTLLETKIRQLLNIRSLDGIVVNSNSDEMLDVANALGAQTVKREEKYATSEVSMSDVYRNMAENIDCDIILYANCTSPLIKTKTIEEMLRFDLNKHDSINSAHFIKEFMWRGGKPINYEPLEQPRSQDLPDILAINFAASLISKQNMLEYKNVIGKTPLLYPVSEEEAVDIDTLFDFKIAEHFYLNSDKNDPKL